MKKDKILVNIEIPEINKSYDMFLSINELSWKTNKLILKAITDLNNNIINPDDKYIILNKNTNKIYDNNIFIKDTDIINGSELVLIRI